MATDATMGKLKRLYQAGIEQHTKTGEILAEIGRVLNGEKGIGDVMKELERELSEIWAARYKAPYVWTYTKDRPLIKKLLKDLSVDEIKARWQSYVRSDDEFYRRARHGFGLFASQVNRFAGIGESDFELDATTPADCKHTPRCKSDQEHTRRRQSELRA